MKNQKKAEDGLAIEKRFSDDIISGLPGIFYLYNEEARLIRWNQKHEEVTGYSAEELNNMHVLDFFDGEEKAVVERTLETLWEEGAVELEASLTTKGGEKIPFHFTGHVTKLGDKPYFLGVGLDITAQKKAEAALEASEHKFRMLAENASDVIWTMDMDQRYTYVSPSVKELRGVSPAEALEQSLEDVLTQDSLRIVREVIARGFEREKSGKADPTDVMSLELEMFHKDGSTVWTEVRFRTLRDPEGKPVSLLGGTRDISRRKKAEMELQIHQENLEEMVQERTDELENAFQQIKSFMMLIEASGQGIGMAKLDGTILYTNPALLTFLGEQNLEAVKKNSFFNYYPEWAVEKLQQEIIPEVMTTGQWKGELALKSRTGQILPTLENFYLVTDDAGDPLFIADVITDISERKVMEEALGQAKKAADEANRAKSEFLTNMSHELRTPMNAILGFSQVLQEGYFGELTEKQAEYVDDILDSGDHLLSLINDILDLSKVEAGKMELNVSDMYLKGLLENSLVMVKERAMKDGIALDLELTEEVSDLAIRADERKLKQIMFNLLSNAVKFTPERGNITIEAGMAGNDLVVGIADSGIGLSAGDLEKVFGEFYQVSGSEKHKVPSTGLGLPLTRAIVELHGGRVWAESDGEGKGSKFTFTIPVKVNGRGEKGKRGKGKRDKG